MANSQVSFVRLVKQAYEGQLRLPAFQRKWVWKRVDVLRLYDSLRKEFPIGGFLLLEASEEFNLSPRPFDGQDEESLPTALGKYVLDGQQRLTGGLGLLHGIGKTHYFLDLARLWTLIQERKVDVMNSQEVKQFADDLDETDGYIKARGASTSPDRLLTQHLFWTRYLAEELAFQEASEKYLQIYNDRAIFLSRVIRPHFMVQHGPDVAVTTLEAELSLQAITRIFSTLNTTGQKLTPFEIVVALLYAQKIDLRSEVDTYRDLYQYYGNMDPNGVMFLQTVALLDGKSPKQSTLPRTITKVNYKLHADDAVESLDKIGKLLSTNIGLGLDGTNRLVSYASMFAPAAIVLNEIEEKFPGNRIERRSPIHKLETWYVGSILSNRYSEGQPGTQQNDLKELREWIKGGEDYKPNWLKAVQVPALLNASPNGAIGKFLFSLISTRDPQDPLTGDHIFKTGANISQAQYHHIFPSAFCEQYLPGWVPSRDNEDVALNIMPVTHETNKRWSKMNPADQIVAMRESLGVEERFKEVLAHHFIDASCIAILEKPNKTKNDLYAFLRAREAVFAREIEQKWGFVVGGQEQSDDEEPI